MSGVDLCGLKVVKKSATTYKPNQTENQSHLFFHNLVVHIQEYAHGLKIGKHELHLHIELMKELRQLHNGIRREPTLQDIPDWDCDKLKSEIFRDTVVEASINFVIDLEDYISNVSLPLCENITSNSVQKLVYR